MTELCVIDEPPAPEIALALRDFEAGFRYPLGSGRWFRICHGNDYTKFFRAIGDARTFVVRCDSSVAGVISVARCRLRLPHRTECNAAYIADLKMRQPALGSTLIKLLREATQWGRGQDCEIGFSIVMDGTNRLPTSYTGRLGIPAFGELAKVTILRVPTTQEQTEDVAVLSTLVNVRQCFERLTGDGISIANGDPFVRSRNEPLALILPSGHACGVLEDTLLCKRLFDNDGNELLSAHLSNFGYQTAEDAVRLIQSATIHCHRLGLPAMFVAIPQADSEEVLMHLALGVVSSLRRQPFMALVCPIR